MEPTPAEITAHFASMDDDPLQTLARERDELTETSQALLLAEFERRHLPVPDIVPRAEEPAYDLQTWVTIDRFRDLSAGIVARGALEAAGIPCLLRDENTVRLDWQISNFIGGMRLQVHTSDEDAARAALKGLALQDDPISDAGPALSDEQCPACGSANITRQQPYRGLSLLSAWLFGIPLAQGPAQWQCELCHHRWPDALQRERE